MMMKNNSLENSRGGGYWQFVLLCLLAIFGSTPAAGQSREEACVEPTQWQTMMQELRSLRIELLQEKILRADAGVAELQKHLQSAAAERTTVDGLERSQAEEVAEFQNQLSQPGLSPQERSELEKHRLLVMTTGAARLAEQRSAASNREAELRQQLFIQQQQRQQLLETLHSLSGAAR